MIIFNTNDREQFVKMEHQAYEGTLDVTDFTPAEYKYFDTLTQIGYKHRHGNLPSDFCKAAKDEAYKEYVNSKELLKQSLKVSKAYQEAILKSDELRCRIEKASSVEEKLKLSLQTIELLTSETGFAERNMRNAKL